MIQGIICGALAVLLLPYIAFGLKAAMKVVGLGLVALLSYAAYKGFTADPTEGATETVNDGPVVVNYAGIAGLVLIILFLVVVVLLANRGKKDPGTGSDDLED